MLNWMTSDQGIILTYSLLSAVMLYAVINGRGRWQVKAAMVCIVPFMGFLIVLGFQRHAGWPVTSSPPDGSIIAGSYILEPNPVTHDPGAIYVWLFPPGSIRPRAYQMPYSRQAHQQLEEARKAGRAGKVMVYKKTNHKVLVYELPPQALPSKERG